MTEYPGNLRAQEKHPGVLERSRNRNFGTGRKPQSFSVKRNFDLGPHEVLTPSLGEQNPSAHSGHFQTLVLEPWKLGNLGFRC